MPITHTILLPLRVSSHQPSITTTSKFMPRRSLLHLWRYLHVVSQTINLLQPHQLLWLFSFSDKPGFLLPFSCTFCFLCPGTKDKGNFFSFLLPSKSGRYTFELHLCRQGFLDHQTLFILFDDRRKKSERLTIHLCPWNHSAEDWK